jgi:hypothetical protein
MSDEPNFHFDVTGAEIEAAVARGDYAWLCEHVFIPATVQFMREKHTAALVKGSRLPRGRRPIGKRRSHRTRRLPQVPG